MKTLLLALLLAGPALAGDEKAPAIPNLGWMTGSWRAELWGGVAEEIYSQPNSGGLFGTFRFTKNDKVVFYEMIVIENHPTGTLLRLKHFHFGLKGWEEKDDFVENKLIESGPKSAAFFGLAGGNKMWLKYRLLDADTLEITMIKERPDKNNEMKKNEDVFRYSRVT